MKKFLLLVATVFLLVVAVGCSNSSDEGSDDSSTLKVSATLDPHSKILEYAKTILADEGIDLEISVLDDYYIFNKALDAGEVDANFFQHEPFFNEEVAEHGYAISNVAGIHIEPFGFYSKSVSSLEDLPKGAEIIISNSVSDHGRILAILDKAGVIELKSGVDVINATVEDIESNPKDISFKEINPELLTTAYDNGEGDLVAINGNYAIQAGLNPTKDAILLEQADSTNPYVNIIAVQKGKENDEKIVKFIEVMKSDEIKQFINDTYTDGSVIPAE